MAREQEDVKEAYVAAMRAAIDGGSPPGPDFPELAETHVDPILSEWTGQLERWAFTEHVVRYAEFPEVDVLSVTFGWDTAERWMPSRRLAPSASSRYRYHGQSMSVSGRRHLHRFAIVIMARWWCDSPGSSAGVRLPHPPVLERVGRAIAWAVPARSRIFQRDHGRSGDSRGAACRRVVSCALWAVVRFPSQNQGFLEAAGRQMLVDGFHLRSRPQPAPPRPCRRCLPTVLEAIPAQNVGYCLENGAKAIPAPLSPASPPPTPADIAFAGLLRE